MTETRSLSRSKSDAIPNEKPPKSRPPVGLREKILRAALPHYSGPYSVGLMDIELPAREPRTFSEIKRDHRHLLKLETVLFAIYYPSGFGSGQGLSPEGEKKWSRATWVPRPRIETAKGYARFSGLPEWITIPLVGATTAFTKIPAWRNARLAEHWPPEKNAREAGYGIKNERGKPPPGEPEKPCFPLLIFSHGLGGTRTTYSSICGEFASYGFIVIALEHRDGSGPRTFVNRPNHDETDSDNSGSDRRDGFSRMDYVFPKDNAKDTAPSNEQGVDSKLRAAQIELRLAEIKEVYHIMTLIHDGKGAEVTAPNLRTKDSFSPNHGGSTRGLRGVDWDSWKGRFHLQQVTMLGHSFGAATAVEVLRSKKHFSYIGQGIIYDIWGMAVQPPTWDPEHRIKSPLLGINSEAFMYWPDNFDSVMKLCKEAKDNDQLVWLMTVRGSVHISQSDFTILYPRVCSLLLKMTVNPRRALDLNINASLEFLKLVMPKRISAMNRGTDERLLDVEKLEKIPSRNRPADSGIGMRLHIPNEFLVRVMGRGLRRLMVKKRLDGKEAPKDPDGHRLEGLQDLEDGGEVWMHVTPTKEELEKHGLGGRGLETREEEEEGGDGIVDDNVQRKTDESQGLEERMMEKG